jgi:hypothetical protein
MLTGKVLSDDQENAVEGFWGYGVCDHRARP